MLTCCPLESLLVISLKSCKISRVATFDLKELLSAVGVSWQMFFHSLFCFEAYSKCDLCLQVVGLWADNTHKLCMLAHTDSHIHSLWLCERQPVTTREEEGLLKVWGNAAHSVSVSCFLTARSITQLLLCITSLNRSPFTDEKILSHTHMPLQTHTHSHTLMDEHKTLLRSDLVYSGTVWKVLVLWLSAAFVDGFCVNISL